MNTFTDIDLDAGEAIIGALDSRLRVQIIWRLSQREHFVHELVDGLGKSQPLISQHLRVLKRSGIVDSERRGREVIYRLVLPEVAELIDAAIQLGVRVREQREEETAKVTQIGRAAERRGSGTRPEDVGQIAHTPAAAFSPEPTGDELPDPAPHRHTPSSFT